MRLLELEAAFGMLDDDLGIRPCDYQHAQRMETPVFVSLRDELDSD